MVGSVTVQIVCDWVKKFNAHGPDGLINRKTPGKTPKLTTEQLAALAAMVESGPIPASHAWFACASLICVNGLGGVSRVRQ